MKKTILLAGLLAALSTAHGITIGFENQAELTSVQSTYPGINFVYATILTAGSSLNELDFPPHSGVNAVFDDSGPISGTFAIPVASLSAYFTYTYQVTFTGFDANGNQVASVLSSHNSNIGSSIYNPNEFLELDSATGIASFKITGAESGSSFTLDDFSFSPISNVPTDVPDTGSHVIEASLLAFVAIHAWITRRVKKRAHVRLCNSCPES